MPTRKPSTRKDPIRIRISISEPSLSSTAPGVLLSQNRANESPREGTAIPLHFAWDSFGNGGRLTFPVSTRRSFLHAKLMYLSPHDGSRQQAARRADLGARQQSAGDLRCDRRGQ